MKLKYGKIFLAVIASVITLSTALGGQAAAQERGLLADGELFTSLRVTENSKVIWKKTIDNSEWIWHNDKGYPDGLGCAVFVYGDNLPATPGKGPQIKGGVPTTQQMIAVAENNYAIAANKNSLVLYATTGPSNAKTDLTIVSVERYGRLLNVVVALKDAKPNTPMTMNITYPETMVRIPLRKLPKYGSMKVRFVDMQGHAIAHSDVLLAK